MSSLVWSALAAISAVFALSVAPAQAATWDTGTVACVINDARIKESSGMSRSTYKRKVRWVHNDSGDTARFFAVSKRCRVRAEITVRLPKPTDWEDMASGPDHTLWFGDIGDNGAKRPEISVVRVKEPKKLRNRTLKRPVVFRLAYPDGPHNAEAMMVHPTSGRVYVITKSPTLGGIYRAPKELSSTGLNVMTRIADAPTGLSSADFDRFGERFFLGGYRSIFVYDAFGAEPVRVPFNDNILFTEAATWARGRHKVLVTGEKVGRPIWRLKELA
ncbi:MAG: hypothetical protein WAW88_02455 [Nocardioides sp.]